MPDGRGAGCLEWAHAPGPRRATVRAERGIASMNMQVQGKIHATFEAEQVTPRFRKREFVLELDGASRYPQLVMFQLTGDRCEALDGYSTGEEVKVEFSLRGREWTSPKGEIRYFNSLETWSIDRLGDAAPAPEDGDPGFGDEPPPPSDIDEIPF